MSCYRYKYSILLSYPAAFIASAAETRSKTKTIAMKGATSTNFSQKNPESQFLSHMVFPTCKNCSPKPTWVSTHFEKAISKANTSVPLSFFRTGHNSQGGVFFFFFLPQFSLIRHKEHKWLRPTKTFGPLRLRSLGSVYSL